MSFSEADHGDRRTTHVLAVEETSYLRKRNADIVRQQAACISARYLEIIEEVRMEDMKSLGFGL